MQPQPAQREQREPSDSTKRRESPGRSEYRVFALRLVGLRERLAQAAAPVGSEQREEVDLLSPVLARQLARGA